MEKVIDFVKNSNIEYLENELMKKHTTFKIGGNARLMVFPTNTNQISSIVKECKKYGVRYITIGNGSNLLVSDDGLDACVIVLGKNFSNVELVDDTTIYASSGASLIKVCRFALENSLSGLEFAYGIPGNVGGGIFMNAGAYGGEIKDVIIKSEHIDSDGNLSSYKLDEMNLSYRHSIYSDNGYIITGAYFKLEKGSQAEIKSKMQDLMDRRKNKQPIEYPSAGSTFKRPEGYFAGALIEECNLKGCKVGGAMVSTKHAGFVINDGNATCSDVLNLCKKVTDVVKTEKGIELEMEIRVTK